MKKLLVVLVLIGSSLFAQNRQERPKMTPEQRLEHLVVKLNLNEEQTHRVQVIQKEHHLKLELLRSDAKQNKNKNHSQIQSFRKDLNVKMRSVLNKEQYADYKRMQSRQQMNKKRPVKQEKRGGRRGR